MEENIFIAKSAFSSDVCATSKPVLRAAMLAQRKKISPTQIQQKSRQLHTAFVQEDVWKQARSVGLYMALAGEVATVPLVEQAWQEGKRVYLPRCHKGKRGEMDFIACTSHEDVAVGAYGIIEPKAELAVRTEAILSAQNGVWDLDLLLVPGVAFDTQGYRIGFGGGYYDRFLQRVYAPTTQQRTRCLGVAFTWQVVKSVPFDAWDMPMHGLLTEEGVLWI